MKGLFKPFHFITKLFNRFQFPIFIGTLISLSLFFVFQNCGQKIDNNSLLSTAPPPVVLNGKTLEDVPFAYDTKVNELAYMSCSHSTLEKSDKNHLLSSTFFTFKMNATGEGNGVGLRKEFKNYLVSKFGDKNYKVDPKYIKTALNESSQNSLTSIQLAIRPMSDPVKLVKNLNSPTFVPKLGTDFNFFLSPSMLYSSLNYDQNLIQILELFSQSSSKRINNFVQKETDHILSTTLNFHHYPSYTEFSAETIRSSFTQGQGSSMLALTYTNILSDPNNQKNPFYSRQSNQNSINDSLVWGTGFKLGFSKDNRVRGIGYSNVLESVSELDLSEGINPTGAKWNCNIRYLIISPFDNDAAIAGQFPHPTDPSKTFSRCNNPFAGQSGNLTLDQAAELELLQRYLPSTDWIIDPINKCIVPNKGVGDCYPNRNPSGANRAIMYFDTSSNNCGVSMSNSNKDCPEFLSLCIREDD